MALIEHVTRWKRVVVAAARCLHNDERVVGNHDLGSPRATDRALHEATAVMPAGAVDTLALGISQIEGEVLAEQLSQPGGEVATYHVTVTGRERPTRDEFQRYRVLGARWQRRQC